VAGAYVVTAEGWLCLAASVDAGSRRVSGWAAAVHLGASLAADALAADCHLGARLRFMAVGGAGR
jgi:transposase InsO family protein